MKLFNGLMVLFAVFFAAAVQGEVQQYILQPGDVISIDVVEHPEFSGRHKIRPDGRINYPVLGEIEVSGLTCEQLVKVMQGKLTSYVNNPVVSVSIEAYYANKVYVLGNVRNSGQFEIYEPVDLLKVLAMCGGLVNQRVKTLKIIRADGSVVTVSTKEIFGAGAKQKYMMYPGDTMFVPHTAEIPWALISSLLGIISVSLGIVLSVNALAKK